MISMYSPVNNATTGDPYSIMCHVNTSEKVNDSIVKIDWTGPDGSIANDSRIKDYLNVSDNSTTYISTLKFLSVIEEDAGLYTCNASIAGANISITRTFELDKINSKLIVCHACTYAYVLTR